MWVHLNFLLILLSFLVAASNVAASNEAASDVAASDVASSDVTASNVAASDIAASNVAAEDDTTPSSTDMFWALTQPQEQYTAPPLPFAINAMEPHIDAETMKIHYDVIFKNHVTKLNEVMKKWKTKEEEEGIEKKANKSEGGGLINKSLLDIWRSSEEQVPADIRREFYQHSGAYINHILYFSTMSPNSKDIERSQSAQFSQLFDHSFDNITEMKNDFIRLVSALDGQPGWIYIARATQIDADREYLTVVPAHDESVPLDNRQLYPVLALDMWEHAYFKGYGTEKEKYIENWWKTVDWVKVERVLKWWRQIYPDGYGKHDEL